jgi:hypothetical protein
MFLNIDQKKGEAAAIIDDEGNCITYGELTTLMKTVGLHVVPRSIVFMLCRNTVGSVIGYLGFVDNEAVPITLNAKIDAELLSNLLTIYSPAYIWAPADEAVCAYYEKVFERYIPAEQPEDDVPEDHSGESQGSGAQ